MIANPATIRNVNKLRAYYGIQTQETAKRVIGLGYADMMEQEMANDPSSRTLSPATTARKSTYMSGTRTSHNNGADAPGTSYTSFNSSSILLSIVHKIA